MACNCKKKVNPKYLEDNNSEKQKINPIQKIMLMIGQFLFGILVGAIVICGILPICLYLIANVCLGRERTVRIPDYTKWFKKK